MTRVDVGFYQITCRRQIVLEAFLATVQRVSLRGLGGQKTVGTAIEKRFTRDEVVKFSRIEVAIERIEEVIAYG